MSPADSGGTFEDLMLVLQKAAMKWGQEVAESTIAAIEKDLKAGKYPELNKWNKEQWKKALSTGHDTERRET